MTVQDRLQEYLKAKRLTNREFEIKCKLGNGTASTISERTRRDTLRRIEEHCDLNIDWLLTGQGNMLEPDARVEVVGATNLDNIAIPVAVWAVIQKQADTLDKQSASLHVRDELLTRMVALLETERSVRRNDLPEVMSDK